MSSNLRIFRDPVHDIISLNLKIQAEQMVFELLDTPEMQRLRRISQLGVSSMTYPGATHTRFLHSLGTFHLCRRVLQHIGCLIIAELTDHLSKQIRQSIECLINSHPLLYSAAILHDIGHGPFSHVIESVTDESHEKRTKKIVQGSPRIREILDKHGVAFEDIAKVIGRHHENVMLVKLVSSQLDADRLDYLIRDSYMTGVKYGNVDLEWLITSLRIGENAGVPEIGLDASKGLNIAESLVFARYHMYNKVYFHKTTRGFEVLIKNILKRAKRLFDENKLKPVTFGAECLFNLDLDKFLALDDSSLWSSFTEWACKAKDKILKDLCSRLLERKPLKAVELNKNNTFEAIVEIGRKKDALKRMRLDADYYSGEDNPPFSYYKNPLFIKPVGEAEASEQIFLIDAGGSAHNLADKSKLVNMAVGEKETIQRFYYDRRADE